MLRRFFQPKNCYLEEEEEERDWERERGREGERERKSRIGPKGLGSLSACNVEFQLVLKRFTRLI
jgi:hypothetical protein